MNGSSSRPGGRHGRPPRFPGGRHRGVRCPGGTRLRPDGHAVTPIPERGKWYRTAGEQVADLANRRVSAVELLDQAIARIEALDKAINAVVVRDFDRARAGGDRRRPGAGAGERRPLLGLPMTVKESFNVAGLPTTWGFPAFKDLRPAEDAVVVAAAEGRRRGDHRQDQCAGGARPTGRATIRSMAPPTIPTTSSGRPAARRAARPRRWRRATCALEARLGHRRLAAHAGALSAACSPTSRATASCRCAATASRGLPALPSAGDGLAVVGPLARSAADLALALDVIAGPDEQRDGVGWRLVLPRPRHRALARLPRAADRHPSAGRHRRGDPDGAGAARRSPRQGRCRRGAAKPAAARSRRGDAQLHAPARPGADPGPSARVLRTDALDRGGDGPRRPEPRCDLPPRRQCRLARLAGGGQRPDEAAAPVGDAVQAMGRRALPGDADGGVQARSFAR